MDERKNRVLQAVIDDYVATAEPVGSRTIARKYRLGVSPATIRNEMADLEELGYLEQPHTSAGRVPSDRGYRYYVDCLMEVREVSAEEEERIRRTFERKFRELDSLIREAARLLSEMTRLTGVAAGPQVGETVIQEIRLVPLTGERALLVYITDAGFIEKSIVDVPPEVTLVELQEVSQLLSDHLRGRRVSSLGRGALEELQRELRRYGALLEQALAFLAESMEPGEHRRLYLGGTTHVLEQPEFRNVEKARALLSFLEQPDMVQEVLGSPESGDLSVQIGEEIRLRELHDCSVISATYRIGGRVVGRLGVIGPRRMEYGRVIGLVEDLTRHLSEAASRGLIPQ
ncbi:heat-inducible transcriptional repressor HrcA [Caldinitratiruptor microaerophilus]|nr:heat-inducible transcriptional repressor HrcA [Caldinitratiruptor microaerophilus]